MAANDDAKKMILARRARFIAAAMAGLAAPACTSKATHSAPDTGTSVDAADAASALVIDPPVADAAVDASDASETPDASAATNGVPDAGPRVTTPPPPRVRPPLPPPTRPQVCLSPPPPPPPTRSSTRARPLPTDDPWQTK